MEKSKESELLTVAEVATRLKMTKANVYSMKARGQIPGVIKLGGRVRFAKDAIEQWIADSAVGARSSQG